MTSPIKFLQTDSAEETLIHDSGSWRFVHIVFFIILSGLESESEKARKRRRDERECGEIERETVNSSYMGKN